MSLIINHQSSDLTICNLTLVSVSTPSCAQNLLLIYPHACLKTGLQSLPNRRYRHLIPPNQSLEGLCFWPRWPRFALAVNMETLRAISTVISNPLLNPGTGEGPFSMPLQVNANLAGLLTKTTPKQSW